MVCIKNLLIYSEVDILSANSFTYLFLKIDFNSAKFYVLEETQMTLGFLIF